MTKILFVFYSPMLGRGGKFGDGGVDGINFDMFVNERTGERRPVNCHAELIDGYPGERLEDGTIQRPPNHEDYVLVGRIGPGEWGLAPEAQIRQHRMHGLHRRPPPIPGCDKN